MPEYTYKDVIIDPNDPRVEIGVEYYCDRTPKGCLSCTKKGNHIYKLSHIFTEGEYDTFVAVDSCGDSYSFPCIIRKKEPEKKYVPFDLSKEEDRQVLRDIWIKNRYYFSYIWN